jgi:hypothetical protein
MVASSAWALNGTCVLTPLQVAGTHGFAAAGTALANTAFAPAGPFAQAGTITHAVDLVNLSVIIGRWSVTLTQTDSSGQAKVVQFGGNYTLDTKTCVGDLTLTSPAPLAAIAGNNIVFREILVSNGDELRTIALIPNLIIGYTSAKKL